MSTAEKQTLTNSRASTFRACPRKHYFQYELGLRTDREGFPLRFGSGFHAAIEADQAGEDVGAAIEPWIDDPYDLALIAATFNGHKERWAGAGLEPISTEQGFTIPLLNPETGAASRNWALAGVVDDIVRLPDGRTALLERKTTSRDFAPGADYWLHLHKDQQLSIYVIAARALGYEIDTVLYDVTRRPAQRMKSVPMIDGDGLKIVLDSANERVHLANGKPRQSGDKAKGYILSTRDETPTEFSMRVAEAIKTNPDHYYARIEIARLDQDLEECSSELWQQQKAIRAAQRAGHWYRNPGACLQPYRCEYLSCCDNRDIEEHTPEGFKRVSDVHPELAAHATNEG